MPHTLQFFNVVNNDIHRSTFHTIPLKFLLHQCQECDALNPIFPQDSKVLFNEFGRKFALKVFDKILRVPSPDVSDGGWLRVNERVLSHSAHICEINQWHSLRSTSFLL